MSLLSCLWLLLCPPSLLSPKGLSLLVFLISTGGKRDLGRAKLVFIYLARCEFGP